MGFDENDDSLISGSGDAPFDKNNDPDAFSLLSKDLEELAGSSEHQPLGTSEGGMYFGHYDGLMASGNGLPPGTHQIVDEKYITGELE